MNLTNHSVIASCGTRALSLLNPVEYRKKDIPKGVVGEQRAV